MLRRVASGSMSLMTIRRLAPGDVDAYAALRREMLVNAPHAFTASPGDDVDPASIAASLAGDGYAIVGAFDGVSLVAAAGINRERRAKRAHVAWICGVYVTPAFRARGLARALIAAAVDHARTWPGLARVQLSVNADSRAARHVYESAGFRAWGTEPDALRVDGRSCDEVYLSLAMAEPPPIHGV